MRRQPILGIFLKTEAEQPQKAAKRATNLANENLRVRKVKGKRQRWAHEKATWMSGRRTWIGECYTLCISIPVSIKIKP